MTSNSAMDTDLSPSELERISEVLGTALHTPFAPPHVYPMSAPAFTSCPEAPRNPVAGSIGLYIHIPFCNYSCSFCFYARRIGDERVNMERYVRALRRELQWLPPGTSLTQLYVGGGTPTALPAPLLDEVLGEAFTRMRPEGKLIHTVECSPESATPAHLAVLVERGIGRVSLGIQSLDDEVLDRVKRAHQGAEAIAACERLVASGLLVNIDLIYGLPGQSEDSFRQDFARLAQCGVHSVTAYNLRVNERTAVIHDLDAGESLDVPRLVRWRSFVQRTAATLGFVQKTWHRFERPGATTFEDRTGAGNQFGAGQSARSRLVDTIYRNHSSMPEYLERVESGRSPVEEVFRLGDEDRKIRFVAQSLGVGKPLDRNAYQETFSRSFDDDFGASLRRLEQVQLVEDSGDAVRLTAKGRLLYDLVTLAFYPQRIKTWLNDRHAAAMARRRRRSS